MTRTLRPMVLEADDAEHAELLAPQSAGDLLAQSLSADLARPVVVFSDSGRVVSAGEYAEIVSRYAQAIDGLGLEPGTRVGLLSKNRPEVLFVNGALQFLRAGVCIVPLHPLGSLDDLGYVVEDAYLEVLIFDPDHYQGTAAQLRGQFPQLRHLLALGPTEVGEDLAALAEGYRPAPLRPLRREPEEIVRLSYSGGTTGAPKAIMTSARSTAAAQDILLKEWEWPAEVRQLVCAPLSHGGGAVFAPTMVRRGSLVVLPGFEPTAVLEAIERYRITCVLLVPTMIYALLDHPQLDEFNLSSLEVVYYGASSISPARLREGIERLGPIFFQFYGQSEAPMSVCVLRRAEHDPTDLRRLGSCGRPVPWVRVKLLDDRGLPVPDGEPGEICVQGPLLMSGYLNKPEATAEALAGGWLHTGDVAVRDPQGYLRIVDRRKDMIVSGGFNVFPREVEDILTTHPAVAEAAVIGVPHERWGEAVTAVVVLRAGASVEESDLIRLVKERKGAVQAPKSVIVVDAIPRTGLGKPDKKALRLRYAQPGKEQA